MTSRRKPAGASSATRAAKSRARPAVRPASQKHAKSPRKAASTRVSARAMPAPAKSDTKPVTAAPGADCTIANAAALHAQLAKLVDRAAPVSLDLAAVTRVDTAGLQVLAAFIRQRHQAGQFIHCLGASENFLATAKMLGLDSLFANPTGGLPP